jgi:uncharacterized protein
MLIKKVRTSRGTYVYDTWTNEILEVDRAVFATLPGDGVDEDITSEARERALSAIEVAKAEGYFRDARPIISNFPPECFDGVRRDLAKGPDHLIVNLTERCNFRCGYCSYSGAYEDMRTHSKERMSRETLQKAIDWLVGFDRPAYSIGFYGGEPLMELPLLREVVSYVRSRTDTPVTFRLTTNGSLLTPEACRFLVDEDFRINISLDGPEEVNDRYRRLEHGAGGFAWTWAGINRLRELDLEFFAKRVTFSLVAAPPTRLTDIRRFIAEHPEVFRDHTITVSAVNAYPSSLPPAMTDRTNRAIFLQERDALLEGFREALRLGQEGASDFAMQFFKNDFFDLHQRDMAVLPEVATSDGQCVPGTGKCMVDLDGTLYMCERVGGTRPIGHVATGFDATAVLAFLEEYHAFLKDACAGCWMLRLCNKCFIHVRKGEAFSRERLAEFCAGQDKRWSWVLANYIALREDDPDIFGWLRQLAGDSPPEISPSNSHAGNRPD